MDTSSSSCLSDPVVRRNVSSTEELRDKYRQQRTELSCITSELATLRREKEKWTADQAILQQQLKSEQHQVLGLRQEVERLTEESKRVHVTFAQQLNAEKEQLNRTRNDFKRCESENLDLKRRVNRYEIELKAAGIETEYFRQEEEKEYISEEESSCRELAIVTEGVAELTVQRQQKDIERLRFEKIQLEDAFQTIFDEKQRLVAKTTQVETKLQQNHTVLESERGIFQTLRKSYELALEEKQRHIDSLLNLLNRTTGT